MDVDIIVGDIMHGDTENGDIEDARTKEQDPIHGMGWLRLVGSLKLQVFLQKSPVKRGDILQKSPRFLSSLLIEATP